MNKEALVDCSYLLDAGASLYLIVDFFADGQEFVPENLDVAVGETVEVVRGFEVSRPRTRHQTPPPLLDHNVREKMLGFYLA